MNYKEFLGQVLASEDWYCIVGLKNNAATKQIFVESLDEIDAEVRSLLDRGYNVYFGCAKYAKNRKRTKENTTLFKALWLDIDCGAEKLYSTQEEGLDALASFCNTLGLPAPCIVNSGNGLHTYWVLEEPIAKDVWKRTAEKLKKLCREHDFHADPAVTADEARILRLPGTLNFKSFPPALVEVWTPIEPVPFDVLSAALGAYEPFEPVPPKGTTELSPLALKLLSDRQNSFSRIVERIAGGTGCAQLEYILTEQDQIPEPLWRAGVSIARNCVDWEVAIHALSSEHPDYSPEETESKAEKLIDKPYRCDVFEDLNPEKCEGCKHKGKIKSPITLGQDVIRSDSNEDSIKVEIGETTVLYPIPPIPLPYFRGKMGGIYREEKDEVPKLIYENDLFIIKRMSDKGRGELVLARLHLPKDKPKEFVIPLAVMNSKEELRKLLASFGCIVMPKNVETVMGYLITCTKQQQATQDVEILRQQMGWTDHDEAFILGDREIRAREVRYSPPSETTESLAALLQPKGTLEGWQEVMAVYDQPGFEPHAFAVLCALGAVLMKFTHYKGAFVNLINSESGTGKTTILRVINSFYGHPTELLSKESDTLAHKLFRLGVLNNLPFTADELTNMKPEGISTLLYAISQGQGPGRMQAQVNMERRNTTTWSTMGIGSGNSSMVETLAMFKTAAAGEVMRLLEYKIAATTLLDKQTAYDLFEIKLNENYGLAGQLFIQWVLANKAEALEIIRQVQVRIDEVCQFSNRDRFWSMVISCNLAGCIIADQIKLFSWNIKRISKWVTKTLVPELRNNVSEQKASYTDFLGQFMNQNINNALIIKDAPDPKTGMPYAPLLEPRSQLLIRIETDTQTVYIASKPFKDYCTENKVICKDLLKVLHAQGAYIGEVKKRLGKGTKIVGAPPVNTLHFKYEFDESMLERMTNEDTHD